MPDLHGVAITRLANSLDHARVRSDAGDSTPDPSSGEHESAAIYAQIAPGVENRPNA